MVDRIYEIKNKIIEQVEKDMLDKGADRIDPEMVDMVKDLADAEKSCWEAEYYRSVVEAMGGNAGYGMGGAQMGYNGAYGTQQGNYGYRDSMGRYARRGYGSGYQEHIEALKTELKNAEPQQREAMVKELRAMM